MMDFIRGLIDSGVQTVTHGLYNAGRGVLVAVRKAMLLNILGQVASALMAVSLLGFLCVVLMAVLDMDVLPMGLTGSLLWLFGLAFLIPLFAVAYFTRLKRFEQISGLATFHAKYVHDIGEYGNPFEAALEQYKAALQNLHQEKRLDSIERSLEEVLERLREAGPSGEQASVRPVEPPPRREPTMPGMESVIH